MAKWNLPEGKIYTQADLDAAVAAARERAFHEGFDMAAGLTPHVHEVMQRKDEAWRKSRAIRAQGET